jgi:hypothetical protein
MKVIITESQYNRAIDHFISYILEPHEERTSKNNLESIIWTKGGDFIGEIENSEYFWLLDEIWDKISEMFDLDYDETQIAIKMWLEEHYNLGILTPSYLDGEHPSLFDEYYN